MKKGQGKTGLIVTIVVLGITLLVVGGLVIWQNSQRSTGVPTTNDPTTSTDTSSTTTDTAPTTTDTTASITAPTVDPATLTSIDVDPLKIKVFYTKGTPGFEYAVMRTADSTQYVTFSAPELVGTKCTNDDGSFASIIKNPSSSEDTTTIAQKVTVGSNTYGLSLTGKSCTSDTTLLEKYQTAFSNGFSQLKEL